MGSVRDEVRALYEGRANKKYGLTAVTQLQHALQSAALAEAAGEPPTMIVAALLHDVGHMIHDLGENPAETGIDDAHEVLGARWLAARFGAAVVEPVRLHVPAKRYLCAVDPAYLGVLSDDSLRSLALQGGPMTAEEVEAFRREPHLDAATRLRRIDDHAKDPRVATAPLEHYLGFVELVALDV